MTAAALLVAAALFLWPAGEAADRLRALTRGDDPSTTGTSLVGGGHTAAAARPGRGVAAAVRRAVGRLPAGFLAPVAAGTVAMISAGPLHAGAAAVLAATTVELRGRARGRRRALTGLAAWERALDDASSALRAGAGPGIALRRAAASAASVEAGADATGGAGSPAGEGRVSGILGSAAAHADLGGDVASALRSGVARSGGTPRDPVSTTEDATAVSARVGSASPAGPRAVTSPAPGVVHDRIAVELAGAWLLATRHGVVLADAVDGLRADVAARRDRALRVDATLAGPRATAVILAALPAFGVLLGSGFGADPLGVLFRGGLGGALCLAGAVFLAAGLLWTDAIAGGAAR